MCGTFVILDRETFLFPGGAGKGVIAALSALPPRPPSPGREAYDLQPATQVVADERSGDVEVLGASMSPGRQLHVVPCEHWAHRAKIGTEIRHKVGERMMASPSGSDPRGPRARFDTTVAHPARVYDYWLGGKDNFEADREAARQVAAAQPGILFGVRANRAFLGRVVRHLA